MSLFGEDWKNIAWNGVCFRVPPSWEVGGIGRRYLLMEDGDRPVLELKWNYIKGSFSHRAHLKRLGRQQKRKADQPFELIDTPEDWAETLTSFDFRSFGWQEGAIEGIGLLLFCPDCRKASFIQFFAQSIDTFKEVSTKILGSFRDHNANGWTEWTIYDIKARTPDELQLDRYLFQPGKFELVFRGKGFIISLYRYGPASVLLRGGGLVDFVNKNLQLPQEPPLMVLKDQRGLVWSDRISGRSLSRLLNRIRRKPGVKWLRFWEPPGKNRVLGIAVHGRKLPGDDLLDRMCADYDAV
jgi:hypothetical protein